MASAALAHLTTLLQAKKLDGTLTRPLFHGFPAISTGVAPFDQRLGGGWPRGQISELLGPPSSGRTSLMLATLASATARGGVVAVVDVSDRFDPASASAAGVDLDRVLWVRGPEVRGADPAAGGRAGVLADLAVRRGLRAFDLIARAGGFAVVVLDLSEVSNRTVRALPSATWLRLAHVLEGRDTAGVLLVPSPGGRSAGGVSLALQGQAQWQGSSAQSRRFVGMRVQSEMRRARRPQPVRQIREEEGQTCFFALSETH